MKDLIIVGGGPGAMSAGVYAARMKLDTILITKSFGGHVTETDKIENYLGFKSISGLELTKNFEEHLSSYDIEIIEDKQVKKIYQEKERVFTEIDDGRIIETNTAIVAAGSKRRKLDVNGEKEFFNKGVTYCAVCDGPLFHDQNVAIIGGGYSGTKSALYLSKIAKRVYLIEMTEKLNGEEVIIRDLKNIKNIEIITKAKIIEIYGTDFVEGLKYIDLETNKEKRLEVEGISIEIGIIPNSDIVDVEKNEKFQIKVDENMKTSSDRIFAIGDINNKGPEQVIVAAAQGCIAALKINEIISKR